MRIAEIVRQKRKDQGLSVRGLAGKVHLSPSYISDIESGRTNPSVETLRLLAKALQFSQREIAQIVLGTEDSNPTPPRPPIPAPGGNTELKTEEGLKATA
jgi:transcriptional regulator with XRE-family HTH domain